jgi:hypothetical protein
MDEIRGVVTRLEARNGDLVVIQVDDATMHGHTAEEWGAYIAALEAQTNMTFIVLPIGASVTVVSKASREAGIA